ncbi:DUF4412 domain-containing protein [Litoribaculum gwangyangense]|uniref:DUF4412 domain-containing protein n=1 Tax=Litoribaculum gwangyangense TaxID=1130722 RepID=A0ABP9C523_9FLAO
MKLNYSFAILIVFVLYAQISNAQLLKKLKNRVEQKVENVIVEKASDKVAEKTSKTMDMAFETNPFGGKMDKGDPALVADTYDFNWKYSLKMTSKQGDVVFDYYLKPGAPYFGFASAAMENMFTVMDNGNKVTTMFMESEGNNVGMVSSMPDDLDLEEAKDQSEGFEITSIDNKTINGYYCQGVNARNADFEMDMYFTNETEVSFDDIYKNQQAKIPEQVKDFFGKDEKVLMIYMDMRALKDKNQSMQMECVGLETVAKTIKKSNYKFM